MISKFQKNKSKELKITNYVAQNEILVQSIKTENRFIALRDEFIFNPKKHHAFPAAPLVQRPTTTIPKNSNLKFDQLTIEKNKQIQFRLRRFYQAPSEKHNYPLTSTQYYGWFKQSVRLQEKYQAI